MCYSVKTQFFSPTKYTLRCTYPWSKCNEAAFSSLKSSYSIRHIEFLDTYMEY